MKNDGNLIHHHHRSREKRSKSSQKAKRCLSDLLTPITKTAVLLEKTVVEKEAGANGSAETRRHETNNFLFESPMMPRMNLANDFKAATTTTTTTTRGKKRQTREEEHTPAPRMAGGLSFYGAGDEYETKNADERIRNYRNDEDIDDFDDCFSIGLRMRRMEARETTATPITTSVPSEIDSSHAGVPMVTPNTVKHLLIEDSNRVVLIDCRYFYEYQNGHISGAHNVVFPDDCQRGFIIARDMMTLNATNRISAKDLVYVFYDDGEANAMAMHHRAMRLFRHVRNLDRLDNMHNYPNLYFPNIFVLKGGFKAFVESSRDREWEDDDRLLYEGSFVPVDDWRFANETRELHNQVVKRWNLAKAAQTLNDFPTRI